ncbi:MAG: hypothetical protein II245_05735, partial [Bacteroidaceae bacterium]|nr:hypothetical protein [Bacteroidaceae bacterium]
MINEKESWRNKFSDDENGGHRDGYRPQPATEEDIKREFGEEVLALVSGVTKLEKIVFKSQEDA